MMQLQMDLFNQQFYQIQISTIRDMGTISGVPAMQGVTIWLTASQLVLGYTVPYYTCQVSLFTFNPSLTSSSVVSFLNL